MQSPSWEPNWFAASQEIPRISRNPKVHYRTHKRPPPVPILRQLNPVHIPTSHFLEIYPNIIHPSTPRSPQWCLSLRLPHQHPIHPAQSIVIVSLWCSMIWQLLLSRTRFTEEYDSDRSAYVYAARSEPPKMTVRTEVLFEYEVATYWLE